jgi:hypothetical protein
VTTTAKHSLAADRDKLRYVKRRFAIPCFEDAEDDRGSSKRAPWAQGVMERSTERAQILADTLHGKWDGLTAAEVRSVLDQLRRLELEPLMSILTKTASVREPIAGGASRFEEEIGDAENQAPTRYPLVVDAGAGTSDFAMF